jgi:probable HAF family extracellular repeat protein
MAAPTGPRDQPPPPPECFGPPPTPPPRPSRFEPVPLGARVGGALTRGWKALGWKGKLLAVCGAYFAANLLVLAFAGLGSRPKDGPVRDGLGTVARQASPRYRYTVTDLGTLGGATSCANGINNSGQVVGEARTSGGQEHAFLWDARHGMYDLGTLGGTASRATGINDSGQIVGASSIRRDWWPTRAFLWEPGRGMQDLGTLGGAFSEARGINNNGQVVGSSTPLKRDHSHAFLWETGRGDEGPRHPSGNT